MSNAIPTDPATGRFITDSAQGYPVFRVLGEVDFSHQPEFETALRSLDLGDASAAIVSFEDCTFFDSSIVGVLMKYWRDPERSWDVVLLTKPGNPVNRVFDIVGIDRRRRRPRRSVSRRALRPPSVRGSTGLMRPAPSPSSKGEASEGYLDACKGHV
jgi:anti-anti-sigma factor